MWWLGYIMYSFIAMISGICAAKIRAYPPNLSQSPFQVPKGRITTSGTFVPPKTQPGVLVQSSSLKSQITASGIIITPSGGEAETQRGTCSVRMGGPSEYNCFFETGLSSSPGQWSGDEAKTG